MTHNNFNGYYKVCKTMYTLILDHIISYHDTRSNIANVSIWSAPGNNT